LILYAKKINLTKIFHIHEHTITEEAVPHLLRYFGRASRLVIRCQRAWKKRKVFDQTIAEKSDY